MTQDASSRDETAAPRIAVVGVHGHGASHVRRVSELEARGEAELIAVVDPRAPEPETLGA